jgi:2-polyprenyl-6-methoxyphenol hydroxylase-like FAD-dependent oxidoreductase
MILVVGAGIGGLSLTIALAQRGVPCEVVERETTWTTVGAGIALYPNGMRVLRDLGVERAVESHGHVIDRVHTMTRDGTVVADFAGEVWDGVGSTVAIHRPALQHILVGAVDLARVRMGVTVRALRPDDEGVTVDFTDGSAGHYELVVGADGIRSTVRALAFGAHDPGYVGQMYWRTTVPAEVVPCSTMLFDHDRFVALLPLGAGLTYLAAQVHTDAPFEEPADGRIRRLRARFADFGGPVPAALDALLDESSLHVGAAEEIDRDEWRAGRVVLIGDAAHACSPTLAQGGSLAMEDAILLADLVAGAGTDLDGALARFVDRREPRARWVRTRTHRQIRMLNEGAPHDHLAAGMRETYAELARPI